MTRLQAAIAAALFLGTALPATAADLTVHVSQIRNASGRVYVTLWDSAGNWLDADKSLQDLSVTANPGIITVVFHDVPPGRYGVVTFHDENGNGQMDFDLLGLPTEGYAFSNDVRPFLSAPSFDRAAISLGKDDAALTIRMVYP